MLTLDKIYHAAFVLKDVARKTDLIEAPKLSKDCQLYLKTENLQATGSFKVRGAYYKISQLSEEESAKGVIACSAGNHAQGVALAATRRGIRSIVCMPDGAPLMKVENTKNLGAEVCLVPGTYDEAHDKAVQLQKEYDMTFIHPYDDEQVIAGQGTIGLEILDQLPDVDAVVVPVGGGGLISGIAFAIKTLRPEVKVYGVQAEGAPSMYRSLHEHKYQTLKSASTFADGIQVKTPGELTYQLCEQYVDDIVTVTEDETAAAILSLMENQKLVAEGAGAVPVAAVLFHKLPVEGKKVACVISGGNIDVNILNRVITRGLVMSGRKANLTIALEDKPGQLKKVAEVVSRWTGIPVSRMLASEREKLLHMEEELHRRVVGQDLAIAAVSDAVRRSRAGLNDPRKPIGSFIFLGTTGVGKTELAKALAEFLFNDDNMLTRIDMSEYQERHSVSRLVGAPPGYVGYDEGGQLTEAVRRKPYSVVLLDEIEKAHPDVFNILLQVLDDGRLTDNKGRTVDFRNTIIIMTSNMGAQVIQENFAPAFDGNKISPEVVEKTRLEVIEQLKMQLKPEFLNRIDEIVMFEPLTHEDIGRIVDIQMNIVRKLLKENNIELDYTKKAKEWIARIGYDPLYGARPVKRTIQRYVVNDLSKRILAGDVNREHPIVIDADADGLTFKN